MFIGDPLIPRFERYELEGNNALANVGKFVYNTATAITNAPIDVVNGLTSEANYIYNNGVGAYLQGAASTVSNAVSEGRNYITKGSASEKAADLWSSMQNPVAWENAVAGAVLALTPMKMSGAGAKTASGMIGAEVAAQKELTTVGRWMSISEYDAMKTTGRVVEGAGGKTSVAIGGSSSFKGAAKGSIYAEFQVPTNSLIQGGNSEWFSILGPNASKPQRFMLQKQGGEILPQIQNLSPIIKTK